MTKIFAAALVAVSLLAASCSSDSSEPQDDAAAPEAGAATCDAEWSMDDLVTVPVDGTPNDHTMTSFDGTEIRLHWFPVEGTSAAEPAPTILMGPGWSLAGDTSTDGAALFGALSISGMWEHGYNVLTWDPRGFGESGGVASVNDPELEGRDAQAMLDFVASQPEAQADGEGDPRAGMVGFSYGGGIQLTLAAIDCRVDALVPGIAWNSLESSLFKAETVKSGWAQVLTGSTSPESLDPHITSAKDSGLETGTLSDEDREWFISRGPGDAVDDITVPTLLIGGTVDTLFTLDEDITNFEILAGNDVPAAMLWFCGGHGTCLTEPGDPDRVANASFDWLERYLKGDTSVDTGPVLELVDQDGARWTSDTFPAPAGEPLTATGSGTLALTAEGGSDGVTLPGGSSDPLGGIVAGITPSRAENAIDVEVAAGDVDGLALGAPKLSLTYSGTVDDGIFPTRVFAQLVDETTGTVVGNQITPIEVVLDGESHTTEVDLEVIAQHVVPGSTLTLQVVATTTAYATPRLGGSITFDDVSISIPMAKDLTWTSP